MPVSIIEQNDGRFSGYLHRDDAPVLSIRPIFQVRPKQINQLAAYPKWGVYETVVSTPVMVPNNSTEDEDLPVPECESGQLPLLNSPGTILKTGSLSGAKYSKQLQLYNKYTSYDRRGRFHLDGSSLIWRIHDRQVREGKLSVDLCYALQLHIFSRRFPFPQFNFGSTMSTAVRQKDCLKRLDHILPLHTGLPNISFLQGEVAVCLSLEYARCNKLGKAYQHLQRAGHYLQNTEKSDIRAMYHYASAVIYNALRKTNGNQKRLNVVSQHLERSLDDFNSTNNCKDRFSFEQTLVVWWMFLVKSGLVDASFDDDGQIAVEECTSREFEPTEQSLKDAKVLYSSFLRHSANNEHFQKLGDSFGASLESVSHYLGNLEAILVKGGERRKHDGIKTANHQASYNQQTCRSKQSGSSSACTDTDSSGSSDADKQDLQQEIKQKKLRKHHSDKVWNKESLLQEFRQLTSSSPIPKFVHYHTFDNNKLQLVVKEDTTEQAIKYLLDKCPKIYSSGLISISEETWNWAGKQNQGECVSTETKQLAAGQYRNRNRHGEKTEHLGPGSELFPLPASKVNNIIYRSDVKTSFDIHLKVDGVPAPCYGSIGCFAVDAHGDIHALTSQHNLDKSSYGFQKSSVDIPDPFDCALESGAEEEAGLAWMTQINNEKCEEPSRPDILVLGTQTLGTLCDKETYQAYQKQKQQTKETERNQTPGVAGDVKLPTRRRRHSSRSSFPGVIFDIAAIKLDFTVYGKEYFQPFLKSADDNGVYPVKFNLPKGEIKKGTRIQKVGARTGLTIGEVYNTEICWNVENSWYSGCFMICRKTADDQPQEVANRGDSGSVVTSVIENGAREADILGMVYKVDEKGHNAMCVNFKANLEELNRKSGLGLRLLSPDQYERILKCPRQELSVSEVGDVGGEVESGYYSQQYTSQTSVFEVSKSDSQFDSSM